MIIKLEILKNKLVIPDHYRIKLKTPNKNFNVKPGQFVMLKVDNNLDPLLPRPFSICYTDDNCFEIIYKVVGKTTKILSGLKIGQSVNILGPLGNGFKIDKKIKKHILIGGGYGIAPLLFLTYELKKLKKEIIVLIGAKNKKAILCNDDFKKLAAIVKVATDDGSFGYNGFVTDLLKRELKEKVSCSIYGCGPNYMLKEISKIIDKHQFLNPKLKILTQISLENIVGCGIGVCLSCVCKGKDGKYKLTCIDGPVFDCKDIIF